MSQLFEQDMSVGIFARVLSASYDTLEYFADVRHVEVATESEVFCPPIVAAQERVYVVKTALARGGVAQVSHIKLADERRQRLAVLLLLLLLVYGAENLGDSTRTYSTFAKHIFVAWLSTESHTSQASTLLTAVVLLLRGGTSC